MGNLPQSAAYKTGGYRINTAAYLPTETNPEWVNELSRHFWNSAIVRAGIRLQIFPLLEESALTPSEVSSHLGANPRFVEAFLEANVALGLLDKVGDDGYKCSDMSSAYLVPGKREYVGDLALHITNYWRSWGNLDRLIVEGRTELPFQNGFTDASTYWADYMKGQHNRALSGQADNLVKSVDLTGKRKLLDLGGGAGSYSMALCNANPGLRAFVIDRKEPLDIAARLVAENGLEDRIELVEGDFDKVALGNDSDVVLISGVALIVSEEECRGLFRRAYEALAPGGIIILQDFMRVDHSPRRSFLDTMMDMYVLIGFDPQAGDRHGDEYASWLSEAGFAAIRQIALPTQLAIITAEKPPAT